MTEQQEYVAISQLELLTFAVAQDPRDRAAKLALADWYEEMGLGDLALQSRNIASRIICEGDRIVTVARDGANMTGGDHSRPIYTTAIYTAVARKRDGVLTWRRTGTVAMHNTSGRKITWPMCDRAMRHARECSLAFEHGVRHGQACPVLFREKEYKYDAARGY